MDIWTGQNCNLQWRIQGRFHGTPFLPSSPVEMYVLRESLVLMEPPFNMNSKSTLTAAHLQVFWSDFWSTTCPRMQQTAQKTLLPISVVNAKMGMALNFHERSFYWNSLWKNHRFATGSTVCMHKKLYSPLNFN